MAGFREIRFAEAIITRATSGPGFATTIMSDVSGFAHDLPVAPSAGKGADEAHRLRKGHDSLAATRKRVLRNYLSTGTVFFSGPGRRIGRSGAFGTAPGRSGPTKGWGARLHLPRSKGRADADEPCAVRSAVCAEEGSQNSPGGLCSRIGQARIPPRSRPEGKTAPRQRKGCYPERRRRCSGWSRVKTSKVVRTRCGFP